MQPTPSGPVSPAPTSAPPATDPVTEFVRADRQTAGLILLSLAALLFAVAGWAAYKASRSSPAADADAQKKTDDPFSLDDSAAKPKDPARTAYIVGALLTTVGFVTLTAGGVWLVVSIPAPTEARQRSDVRAMLLAVGGLLGAVLIVSGVVFFYLWSAALADWLDKDKWKEAKWVLYPLLMVVSGGALMFVSAQPARAEERGNQLLRKLVYGTNMGLGLLLLFVALVALNLFLGPRLPNKLDATEAGFYSLSTGTTEYLGRLDQPVTAYAILSDNRAASEDIRRLLQNCQDVGNGKFQARFISPVSNKSEYRALSGKYPVLEANETGVLLTVGEDEKRHTFIRDDEFVQRDPGAAPGADGGRSFVGESRLMRELLFLSESEKKAVVYFTQQAGELAVDPPPGEEVRPVASAAKLKAYLERNYLEVKPLRFEATAPKVPDDAAVVVVAEPQLPLADAHVAAIRQYMTEPRGGKKGKLIVLAGPQFDRNGRVIRTGLDALLLEFNVRIADRMIFGEESRELDPITQIVGFTVTAWRERNPVAVALGEKATFVTQLWRPVAPVPTGNPAFKALPLLVTAGRRMTWLEDEIPRDLNRTFTELNTSDAARAAKQLNDAPRSVGVVVSEGESGRVAVIGSGRIVSDQIAQQARGGDPITFDLVGGTVDWLRDRPALVVSVENKKYKMFTMPATADDTRGLWFPLLFALVVVTGAGASVWMVRRRTI